MAAAAGGGRPARGGRASSMEAPLREQSLSELMLELQTLQDRRAVLSGSANKKSRQKLNQRARLLESLIEDRLASQPPHKPEPQPEPKPEPEPTSAAAAASSVWAVGGNYLPASAPGCHIARFDASWIVGVGPFAEEDFGLEAGSDVDVPDLSVDPEEQLLSVCSKLTLYNYSNSMVALDRLAYIASDLHGAGDQLLVYGDAIVRFCNATAWQFVELNL